MAAAMDELEASGSGSDGESSSSRGSVAAPVVNGANSKGKHRAEGVDDGPGLADDEDATFASLGLIQPLCEACASLKFSAPTPIQRQSIPVALSGRDIIGLAQTGSGKTAAFALPVLQALWDDPSPLFACVLAPTRELAYQIGQQFEALGSGIGVRTAVIVGGMDMMSQAIALSKRVSRAALISSVAWR